MSMMTKPSLSRRCFSASISDRLGMNLKAPSSGRCGLRYWIITRGILRRRHVVECARDNRSWLGSEITHVGSGRRSRFVVMRPPGEKLVLDVDAGDPRIDELTIQFLRSARARVAQG